MPSRILPLIIVVILLVVGVAQTEARGIRTDGQGGGNGWSILPSLNSGLPSGLALPNGLMINPLGTSSPFPLLSPPLALVPSVIEAGSSVTVVPQNDVTSMYDAQTYPDFLVNANGQCDPTVAPIDYYACVGVPGIYFEWLSTDGTSVLVQVAFFNLPAPTGTQGFDTNLYDAFGNNLTTTPLPPAATGAWEIEFNCGGTCPNGASLLWNGTLYVAPATAPASEDIVPTGSNVLSATSITVVNSLANPPAPTTISAPSAQDDPQAGSLLNEFVFDGVTLYPPPGWTAITIAVPGGLSATPGNGSVSLTWMPTAGASSYNIYQATAAGGESSTPVQTGVTVGNALITGLKSGSKYFFEVTAVYNGVESGQSSEINATVLPATPAGLTASAGAASIALNWNAAAGASSYSLYEGARSGAESATPIATGITGTSYTDSGLKPGEAYFYTLIAVDAGGNSAASNEATTTVLPSTPVGVSATAKNGAVSLSWTASAGATSYSIYQGSSAGGEGNVSVASVTGTSTTISGLANGQTYYFKVAAADAGGVSAQSNEASATPVAPAGGGGGGGAMNMIDLLMVSLLVAFRIVRNRPNGELESC